MNKSDYEERMYTMDKERLKKQIDFILEADKEKNILRQTHLSGNGRRENDAEHAWHMAIMVYLLKEYANEEFDVAKAMMMALIHDIVEIDAGDTYAYDVKGRETKKMREEQAAERIYGLLPDNQGEELKSLFQEYEASETPEARFVRVMDNFQPLLLNHSNNGRDWREHEIRKSQVMKRHMSTKLGSNIIWEYAEKIIEEHVRKGNLKDD
ncbi:MAG: HD domain-containing protein [Bacillus sp. (in: Bacteria)]|nr:HD domain-containing protein [Bacillus sp. (in: firmicutes)]